jgi:predicted Zn-dependent protease
VPAVPARAAAAIVLAVGLLVLLPTWLSTRLVSTGLAARDSADLRWARRLDPVSVQPLIAEAEIAATPAAAIKPLEQARQRAPRMLAVRYLLGSAFWHAGKRQAALAELRSALALHPHDGAVERAIEIVRRRTSAGKKA